MRRAVILVLDSFGIGAAPDAERFGDAGSDTLGHIAEYRARSGALLRVPNLARLGLLHAARDSSGKFPDGCDADVEIIGAYGYAEEMSTGKDTPSGHWEMAGVPVLYEWGYFRDAKNTFPPPLLQRLIKQGNLPGVLGNCHASGTEIIAQLGEEHVRTRRPIVYTSADSVFQIACHEEAFGLERLLDLCQIARKLVDEYRVARVIARPFIGKSATDFKRTGNRHDFAVPPPAPTVLDKLLESGGKVIGIGKIPDIFAHRGFSREIQAHGNEALFDATLEALASAPDHSIVFSNFVDFDTLYGHRRDADGYARALEQFDARLPALLAQLLDGDIVILSADHGCDPTWPGSDHTREHIPVLVYGHRVTARSLGRRSTFADIGQSLAGFFDLPAMDYGTDFL
ncbi:MAG TPA: phosphopentomutase [Steroidobacteraceae bacterium]